MIACKQFLRQRRTWASSGVLALVASALTMAAPLAAQAQTAPLLGTAASFGVLGGTTVTNTRPTVIGADLGVSPGSAVTGFPPGRLTAPGAMHKADAVAVQAQSDVTTAYNTLAGLPCTGHLTGQDLGGLTLLPGVYCFTSSAGLTGDLTLNAQGDPAALFVFQIGSTLTTASASTVKVINGGASPGCNVYWQVASSATIGTTTTFVGNVLALTSIALQNGATLLPGRALARNGAVTLDNNRISPTVCNAPVDTGGGSDDTGGGTGIGNGPPDTSATPELDSVLLFGSGIAGLGSYAMMRARARRKSSVDYGKDSPQK